jgi:hypothetical protein
MTFNIRRYWSISPIFTIIIFLFYIFIGPMGLLGSISFFPFSLKDNPLLWWPIFFWPTLIFFCIWSIILLFTGGFGKNKAIYVFSIILFCISMIADSVSGTALYADKIVTRNINHLNFKKKIIYMNDIVAVEMSCEYSTSHVRRGFDRTARVATDYVLLLSNGQRLDLTDGLPRFRNNGDYSIWILAVSQLNSLVVQKKIPKMIATYPVEKYDECINLFSSDFSLEDRFKFMNIFSK